MYIYAARGCSKPITQFVMLAKLFGMSDEEIAAILNTATENDKAQGTYDFSEVTDA